MSRKAGSLLVERVEKKIRQMIINKVFVDVLPGERKLCDRLSVGRDTLRKALSALEREQWIAAPKDKTQRRILKTEGCGIEKGESFYPRRHIGFLTSQSLKNLSQSLLAEIYAAIEILEEDDISIRIVEAPWVLGEQPDRRLDRLIGQSDNICWILHHSSEQTQLWFKKHNIPCIVRGTSYYSSKLPYLDRDWTATTHHAASCLWGKGHRTVGLCLPQESLKGHQLMKRAFCDFSEHDWNPVLIPEPPETPLFFDQLDEAFKQHPDMSALIAARGNQIIPILCYSEVHDMPIPERFSLISLNYESFMERLYPSIAFYEDPSAKTVRKLVRMLRALLEGKQVKSVSVIPEMSPGSSVIVPFCART